MIIYNCLINGKICSVETKGEIISNIGNKTSGDINADGMRVIPGLIDIHTHGIMGYDTMNADFEPMCRCYAESGTTTVLPTTMTMPVSDLKRVDNARTDFKGADIYGFHFEGPYIAKSRKGAQDEANIRRPDYDEFKTFKNIKLITVAPEVDGCIDFISKASKNTVISIGHTDCDCETAIAAIDNGASCLTHTFNAMPPLLHRNPGPIGAAVEKHIYAQLICDGFHISKAAVIAAYRMFGDDRIILISDSLNCTGLADGNYISGGLKVVLNNGVARLENGTIAGSAATLLDCVKKAIQFGIPFDSAVKIATETPANLLNIKKGRIKEGYIADLLIIDNELNVLKTIIGGKLFE